MKTILLIEESPEIRKSTKEILERADYKVITADNSKEGIVMGKLNCPDLIVCDIKMPNLDGLSILSILGRNPETSRIPFIFLTAEEITNGNRKITRLGSDDYISKSYSDSHMLEVIETRLKKTENIKKVAGSSIQELQSIVEPCRGMNELKRLFKDAETMDFNKDATIYREGGHADFVYLIDEGSVQCSKSDYYGKSFVHEVYGAGCFLGYKAMIKNGTYNETALTLTKTKLSLLPKRTFLNLIQDNIEVANFFIETLSTDVIEREKLLLQLAYAPLRERLSSVLLKVDMTSSSQDEDHLLNISRQDLANMVGAAKESLIRSLSELRKEGLLDTEGQLIKILDLEGLKRVATGL